MNETEKASVTVGAVTEAAETGTVGTDTVSATQYNTGSSILSRIIGTGKKAAVKSSQILPQTLFKDFRALKHEVETERQYRVILAGVVGYWFPQTDESGILTDDGYRETAAWYRTMRAKALTTLKNTISARKAMRQYEQRMQLSVFDDDYERILDQFENILNEKTGKE